MSRQRTGTRNIPYFKLSAGLLALLAATRLPAVAPRTGSLDPEFTRLPFAEWAAQGKQTGIRWSVDVPAPQLSTHQRLMVRIAITVDGRELERRRGKGDFLALLQLEDSAHHLWQNHASMNLESVRKGVSASNIEISNYAFVLPGDYTLSLAICDTATLEHSFVSRKLHVGPLKDDPLPEAWSQLPPVEFVRADSGPPDIWYLPDIESRLHLPIVTKRPVRVELLVNMTPSERAAGSLTTMRRNMSLLIPALKVFSAMKPDQGSIEAALLDLTQKRVAWEQRNVHEPDWSGLRRALVADEPGKIDVHALQGQRQMREYFVNEIRRRMEAPKETPLVLIVLSGPAFFLDQDMAESVAFPNNPDRKLIYIRDRSIFTPAPGRGRFGGGARGPGRATQLSMPTDDLQQAVRAFSPHVYDAATAAQFRRIVAEVLRQIEAM
ncbi:MAG: hypothetical protein M3N54_14135 [Acidobacteriota bacterium]|nr:hypothetical protein [Acidobacteriota bacterium]